eukprot:CAMPEP_0169454506 /NCGR_PEP_ID=MMETSP1042-20121227/15314_1 /TAXON_ID=464988 /ORGANISM="Hemiselmis andersenii, Strain CCMP1180" /LENGTH=45 /DNA_ID= /DNA_START= /DNA_END= /DNA_ORIENTATION=
MTPNRRNTRRGERQKTVTNTQVRPEGAQGQRRPSGGHTHDAVGGR